MEKGECLIRKKRNVLQLVRENLVVIVMGDMVKILELGRRGSASLKEKLTELKNEVEMATLKNDLYKKEKDN